MRTMLEIDKVMAQKKTLLPNPVILLALIGLYLTSLYSFLVFHTLGEFFSILVAFSIFTISWNARRLLDGSYLVLLGVAYLCVGSIDILHTLAFKGMGVFPAYDTNLPTQFWIAARYMEALSLLAVPLLIKKKVNPERTLALYFAISFVLVASIFGRVFPDCYIEGVGLTEFKKMSEYVICSILFTTIILMIRKRSDFEPEIFNFLIASIAIMIASEFSFISYISVYGYEHIIGHILKVLSFYLMYRAIVVTSIVNPYDSLFWNLNRSREWFRTTLGSIGDAVIAADSSGLVTFLNPVAEGLTGWKSEEASGQPIRSIFRIVHEKTHEPAENIVDRVLREGNIVNLANHTSVVHRDGREIPIEDSAAPIRDSFGNLIGVVVVFHDVTEKRRIQDSLRASEELLRLSMRAATAGAWEWDLRTGNNVWSQELWQLYGLEPGSCNPSYEAWLETVHPNDLPLVERAVREAALNGTELNAEWRVCTADGTERWLMSRGQPERDGEGKVARFLGIVMDMTERKRVEGELRESQSRLDLALRSAHMGVWHWDIIENRRWFDDQVCRLLGIDPAKFTGTVEEFFNAVHPDDRTAVREALARAIELDGTYETEYRVVHTDGTIPHIEARGRVVRDDNGQPVRLNGILWDITERKEMEAGLLQSRDELEVRVQERTAELQMTNRAFKEYAVKLERLNEELRDFAFIASHDLQEPVRKIQVLGDMLVKKSGPRLDEGGRDCAMRMARSARQMGGLIQSLLEYSRLTTRFVPLEQIDLSCVVKEVIEDVKPALDRIEGQIEVGVLPVIKADGAQMRHLLKHLIENSIKFSKKDEASMIKVYGQCTKDNIRITVEDNGIGFDEAYIDRIFRPFQQLHQRKGQYDGTGMGLAICRKIVELHGGTITARSTSGVGSTFSVSLPVINSREGSL